MAHTTEINVNGVITPVVHFDHSAQEIDNAVEAARNALPRNGSQPMTGDLVLSNRGRLRGTVNGVEFGAYDTQGSKDKERQLVIMNGNVVSSPTRALRLRWFTGAGVYTDYDILHTGNKPSGSYTGNGSATARTINTGGTGNVCMVKDRNNSVIAFCTPSGVIYTQWRNGESSGFNHLGPSEGNFTNGVLTSATAKACLNYNGTIYDYQVL